MKHLNFRSERASFSKILPDSYHERVVGLPVATSDVVNRRLKATSWARGAREVSVCGGRVRTVGAF